MDPNQQAAADQANTANPDNQANQNQNAAPADQAKAIAAGPTTADVVSNSQAIREHIEDTKEGAEEAEKKVLDTVPGEHHGKIREIFTQLHNDLANLLRHSDHNVNVAKQADEKASAAPAAGTTAPRSTATSDAHLNTGNGGPVTGNPGASFAQASAAQMAVEQGAKIPGVATVPQPDVAVR